MENLIVKLDNKQPKNENFNDSNKLSKLFRIKLNIVKRSIIKNLILRIKHEIDLYKQELILHDQRMMNCNCEYILKKEQECKEETLRAIHECELRLSKGKTDLQNLANEQASFLSDHPNISNEIYENLDFQ